MTLKHTLGATLLVAIVVFASCNGNNKKDKDSEGMDQTVQGVDMTPKRLLLIVDPQNDFITGSLAVAKGAEAMDRLAKTLGNPDRIKEYSHILITQDSHPKNHCSFKEQGGAFPAHCVEGTEGAGIYPALQNALNTVSIPVDNLLKGNQADKEEFSILQNESGSAKFKMILDEGRFEGIDICGIASDYCVYETLKDLLDFYPANKIRVVSNCVASVSDDDKLNDFMKEKQVKGIRF